MQSSPSSAFTSLPSIPTRSSASSRTEEAVYQAFTIASILMLLCSLWVF